nr:MAG TPA: Glutaredoxin arsenate reductase [Caudoviricetes sp.]
MCNISRIPDYGNARKIRQIRAYLGGKIMIRVLFVCHGNIVKNL